MSYQILDLLNDEHGSRPIFKQQFPVDDIFILRQDVVANELQIRNTLIIESTYNTKIIIGKIYVVFRLFQCKS